MKVRKIFMAKYREVHNVIAKLTTFIGCTLFAMVANAALPGAPTVNGVSTGSNDYLKLAQGIGNESVSYAVPLIYAFVLILASGVIGAALLRAKKHNEWGPFICVFVAVAAVVIFVLYLLNSAKTTVGV